MAKKEKKEKGAGGSKKKLLVIVGGLVAVLFVAKSMGLVGGKPTAGAETLAAGAGATTTTEAPGPIVALESITLNTADGHYLKLGLALRLAAGGGAAAAGHDAAAAADPTAAWAEALDLAIEVMGGRSYGQLVTPEGRAAAKEVLEHRLVEAYHGEVVKVYLTEFVLQ